MRPKIWQKKSWGNPLTIAHVVYGNGTLLDHLFLTLRERINAYFSKLRKKFAWKWKLDNKSKIGFGEKWLFL